MAPLGDPLKRWKFYDATTAPRLYDVALCRFPFDENPDKPPPRRSPCIIRQVRLHKSKKAVFVQVVFGTSNLKTMKRVGKDLYVVNSTDMTTIGLWKATRFDLWRCADLPWSEEWFPIPNGKFSPILGRLPDNYIKKLQKLADYNLGKN